MQALAKILVGTGLFIFTAAAFSAGALVGQISGG